MLNLTYDFFDLLDGSPLTMEQRIQAIVNECKDNESIVFEDERECSNEQELRDVLREKGYIQ